MKFPLTARCMYPARCPFKDGEFCAAAQCAVEDDSVCLPTVSAHETRLRSLECLVTDQLGVTLHHCRGGSMAATPFGVPGMSEKQNAALQIPLKADFHFGRHGIDARIGSSIAQWEEKWGTQVAHLNSLSSKLRYNLWALAWRWTSPLVKVRVDRFLKASHSRYHQQ